MCVFYYFISIRCACMYPSGVYTDMIHQSYKIKHLLQRLDISIHCKWTPIYMKYIWILIQLVSLIMSINIDVFMTHFKQICRRNIQCDSFGFSLINIDTHSYEYAVRTCAYKACRNMALSKKSIDHQMGLHRKEQSREILLHSCHVQD